MSARRIKNHGKWIWQARVAYLGRRTSQICENKDAARTAEGELLRALKAEAGADAQEAGRPATLEDALDGYKFNMVTRGKGADSVGNVDSTLAVLRALLPELLAKPVGAIGDRDIFAVRNVPRPGRLVYAVVDGKQVTRQELAKPSTINRTLQNLRAALKLVRPEYRFPAGAFFQEDESRVRWLRPEEELLVLDGMPSPFREIAQLAALTLMRRTEIRLLRREDVHLEQGVILLPRAKAGARPVILNGAAQKILQGQLAGATSGDLVFPGPEGRPFSRQRIGRAFRRAARGAGLRDFHFHDLRHHGATMALNAGFTAPVLMQLGGWKTERMMRRYAAVTDTTLRAAAEAVAGNAGWQRRDNPVVLHASAQP